MRILVAGGTGAVGRRLVPLLISQRHQVFVITRSLERVSALCAAGAAAAVCDVYDRRRLLALVRESRAEAVIHQLTDLPRSMDPRKLAATYDRNNRVRREGTRNLLDAAAAAGARRFVVQSMGSWYRPAGGPVKTEADPLWTDAPEPIGAGVRTAIEMEKAVLREVPVGVVLRYGGFYGPGTWYAADADVAGRMRKRAFPIIGRGDGIMSFIHVDDAASAAVAALAARTPATYNVTDDHPAPAREWMPAFAQAVGAPRPFRMPALLAGTALGGALTEWLTTMRGTSNAKIKAELGWRPAYPSWREGFRHLA